MKPIRLLIMAIFLTPATTPAQTDTRLHIVATSDIHGNYLPYDYINRRPCEGGLSRVQTYVSALRRDKGADKVILLDNGDILQGQPAAYYYNFVDTSMPHLCARALNRMGYDAATVGNHDVETGHGVYDRWTAECGFPVLAANVTSTATGQPYWQPYTVVERGGLRVAVLGLLTPSIPQWLPEVLWSGMRFEDLVTSARLWVDRIRREERPDIIVGLLHSGVGSPLGAALMQENAALAVAQQVEGLDLVVCGHDHREAVLTAENAATGRKVPVLNPGANGMKIVVAEVCVTRKDGRITAKDITGRTEDISGLTPDADFVEAFRTDHEAIGRYTSEVIGHNSTPLSTRPAYFGPSAFVDLIHTLQLEVSGADISFCAPLSFDAQIPAGDIRVSDMFNLYRYENQLYVMRLTGEEIKQYLEYSYWLWTRQMNGPGDRLIRLRPDAAKLEEGWQRLRNPAYNFDSAAGLRYTVDVTKPKGEKIHILSLADGRPFVPEASYRVAVNSYRGGGGGELLTKGAGIPKDSLEARIERRTDRDLRHYLIEHIRRLKDIHPQPRHEWKFVPEDWARAAAQRDSLLLFR